MGLIEKKKCVFYLQKRLGSIVNACFIHVLNIQKHAQFLFIISWYYTNQKGVRSLNFRVFSSMMQLYHPSLFKIKKYILKSQSLFCSHTISIKIVNL